MGYACLSSINKFNSSKHWLFFFFPPCLDGKKLAMQDCEEMPVQISVQDPTIFTFIASKFHKIYAAFC